MTKTVAGGKVFGVLAFLGFALVATVFLFSAPMSGNFAWSDAPRHAMNGIFVLDLVKALPFSDPRGWAESYYIQYPALSILFYPPLFSGILAGLYETFGFSHATAQATVAFFHFALLAAVFVLARRWMPLGYAFGAALVLGVSPEVSLWARQVMLDIPAYAWLLWSVVFLFRYVQTERMLDLVVFVALYLASLYTKQNGVFALLPMLFLLLQAKGWRHLVSVRVLSVAAAFVIALVPLVVLQIKFGGVNTESLIGGERDDLARTSFAAWMFYAKQLPSQLGWPSVSLAIIYWIAVAARGKKWIPGPELAFLLLWFVSGYVFFSLVMVREPRHDLMALWPVAIFALLGLRVVMEGFLGKFSAWSTWAAPLGLGLLTMGWGLTAVAVPRVDGYGGVAAYVVERTPRDSNILFSGYRDGNFVFAVRSEDRGDVGVLRADKLLLRLSIERERGVEVVEKSRAELLGDLARYRVRYVVAQPDFWGDLASMRLFSDTLEDSAVFRLVKEIEVEANYENTDKRLRIYEFLGEIADEPDPVRLEMVGIGETFSEE